MNQKQNPLTIAHYQHRLGTIQFYRGDLAQSEKLYLESLEASLSTNDYGLIAINLSMLGQVYFFLHDFERAFHIIKRSLSYSEPHGISHCQMHSLWVLSETYLAQNDLDKAEPIIWQTITVSSQCDEAAKVFPYCSMVKLLRLRGKHAQALEWAVDALQHADKFKIEPDIGWVYMQLGLTYFANRQTQEAKTYLKKAEEKLKRQLHLYLNAEIEKLQSRNDEPSGKVLQREPEVLTIRTLGPFAMAYGGQAIRIQRKSSLRLLLYFIATRERKLTRDSILDQVFPAGSFQAINNQFYVALSTLSKALEPMLRSGRQSRFFIQSGEHYTFSTKELMLDADRFLQLSAEQPNEGKAERIERLRQAEQLYCGDFLEEYPYESYLETEREKLRRVYLKLMRELAGYYWDCNDYPTGMNYYEKLLEKDPYLENVYVEYVERLLQAKFFSNAREVSERGVKYMEQELGIPLQGSIDTLFRKYSL
ncbi:tetratricopeptide repeat protein [Brevibacillus fluminis]|uniref:tetratricopeptide repeat protein n=1 Tax=Brevibacillus fluminis TaxID=511487 RepID=UPI003F8C051C